MKKLLLSTVLSLILFSARAQDKSAISKFQFGMKATPAINWLRSDTKTTESDGILFRPSYGFIATYRLTNNYFICSGIDVNYKGGKLLYDTTTTISVSGFDSTITTTREMELRTNYVELPISLLLKTKEIGYLKYFLQVGVAPGVNIRSKYNGTVKTRTVSSSITKTETVEIENEDIASDINLFNLSMALGAGIEYNLTGSTSIIAGVTFSNGLIKVTDKKAQNPVLSDAKVFANLLGLNIGIVF
jgi:opacity protein-like surface antigen